MSCFNKIKDFNPLTTPLNLVYVHGSSIWLKGHNMAILWAWKASFLPVKTFHNLLAVGLYRKSHHYDLPSNLDFSLYSTNNAILFAIQQAQLFFKRKFKACSISRSLHRYNRKFQIVSNLRNVSFSANRRKPQMAQLIKLIEKYRRTIHDWPQNFIPDNQPLLNAEIVENSKGGT